MAILRLIDSQFLATLRTTRIFFLHRLFKSSSFFCYPTRKKKYERTTRAHPSLRRTAQSVASAWRSVIRSVWATAQPASIYVDRTSLVFSTDSTARGRVLQVRRIRRPIAADIDRHVRQGKHGPHIAVRFHIHRKRAH